MHSGPLRNLAVIVFATVTNVAIAGCPQGTLYEIDNSFCLSINYLRLAISNPGWRPEPLTIIGQAQNGSSICTGPLGPGPCENVKRYMQNHPELETPENEKGTRGEESQAEEPSLPVPVPAIREGGSNVIPREFQQLAVGPNSATNNSGQLLGGPYSVFNNPHQVFGAPSPGQSIEGTDTARLKPPTIESVRVFLMGKDIPPSGIAAYGVVAFRGRPTSATRARLLMACNSFQSYLDPEVSLSGVVAPNSMMVTIWPLHHPEAVSADNANCDTLIDDYDLFGADAAIADAERQNAKFGDDGPFLIGWSPSSTRGQPDKLVLVMDMSHLNSQDSFDREFIAWKQKIIEDPSRWRNGFSLEDLRLAVRDFLDDYGQPIMTAFSSRSAEAATPK
jgi:hypothetical protein